jgi:parallel beta-helix repeat protein
MRARFVSLLAALAAAVLAPVPTAAGLVACGGTVTTSITFDANLDCAGDGLIVGADKVTIDLNGFALSGNTTGVGIQVLGFEKVTIENGLIESFEDGIHVGGNAQKVKITDVTVFGCQGDGIDLDDSDAGKVKGCFLNGNLLRGLTIGPGGQGNKIEKTTAVGHSTAGFEVGGSGNVLKKVDAAVNTQGILLLGDGNEVSSCRALRSADHGIEIEGSSNEVAKCDVAGSLAEGILVDGGSGNVLEKNVVTGSRQDGILLTDADGTVVKKNTVSASELDGIAVAADSAGVLVEGNESFGNHTDGIDTESASTTLKKNEVYANGELGIEADGGAIDGGGNEARDNADGGCTGGIEC